MPRGHGVLGSRPNVLTGSARTADRPRLFEQPIKPKITKRDRALEKKREGLARVLERLQASDVRPGLAKELRQHVATLEREIAKWSGAAASGSLALAAGNAASAERPSAALIRPFYSKVAQFELRHPTVWVMPDDALDILACHPGSQTIKVARRLRIEDQRRVAVAH